MPILRRISPIACIVLCGLLVPLWLAADEAPIEKPSDGALKAYVAKPDSSYHWTKRRDGKFGQGTFVELTLTSQTWKNIVWKHQLFVYRPSQVKNAAQGLLLIGGGAWHDEFERPIAAAAAPSLFDKSLQKLEELAALAEHLQAPVAVLLQVPEEPILGGRTEDQIISYTFAQYLLTNDPEWPLLLPMTKSAVRGMDAVQEFCRQEWSLEVKRFIVTGASKRGWTTWLTAAIDPRVNGLAPMVIDTLNFDAQMKHQTETYGKYSDQLRDYSSKGLQGMLGTERGKRLTAVVDPYSYRAALKQPKFLLLGTNDRYWTLDSLNLYWNDLQGEKYVCYTPNSGHSLNDPARIAGALNALHGAACEGKPLPKLAFQYADGQEKVSLRVQSDIKPRKVRAWTATSATRDFRDAKWESHPMQLKGGGHSFDLPQPAKGFAALFGEAVYAGDGLPLFLSTNVKIVGR